MNHEIIRYDVDGLSMESHLYRPEDRSRHYPGILVFPEAFGLGDHAKARAERLADLGYVALACDLHGGGAMLSDFGEVMSILGELKQAPHRIRERAAAGLRALKALGEVDASRVAAIGYCFGGTMALELARDGAELRGVVGFHAGLATATPDDARNVKAKILVCIGSDDPTVPAEERAAFEQEMRAGGVDWQMNVHGRTVHSFTNPEVDQMGMPEVAQFNPDSDARSWKSMIRFFEEIF